MKKQHMLLDKTTIHFIAHHSCWCWYNLRMYVITQIFFVMTMIVIAKNRVSTDTVTLTLLFGWASNMDWIMHFFGCINWFMRSANEVQRVFNL